MENMRQVPFIALAVIASILSTACCVESQAPADVPDGRMSYSQTLRRVLSQAKMKYDLRVDEAEKPFLWITTVKPVR